MYIHIGNDFIVNKKKVIGIFDIENTSTSHITKDFLNANSNIMAEISQEMPKSFLLCDENILVSNISVATIKKRWG